MILVAWLGLTLLASPPAPPTPNSSPTPAPPPPSAPTPHSSPAPTPAPPPPRIERATVDAALAALPPGPSLGEVQAAALARAQVDVEGAARWLRRARLAAAAPTLSFQYDHRLDRGWTLDQAVGEADALRDDTGQQGQVRAKLTWQLDRLIFNPDELRAARALIDLAELRERVLVEITQLYFERQRLLVEHLLSPPTDLDAAITSALRLRELEGLLEGLTGLSLHEQTTPDG